MTFADNAKTFEQLVNENTPKLQRSWRQTKQQILSKKWVPLDVAEAEIAKWSQQQKDDYATFLEKVAEKDKEIQRLKDSLEICHQLSEERRKENRFLKFDVIVEAQKILDEIEADEDTWDELHHDDRQQFRKWLERLRLALSPDSDSNGKGEEKK